MASLPDTSKSADPYVSIVEQSKSENGSCKSIKSVLSKTSQKSSISRLSSKSSRRSALLAEQRKAEIDAELEIEKIELESKKREIAANLAKKKVEIQAALDEEGDDACSGISHTPSSRSSISSNKIRSIYIILQFHQI